MQLVFKSLIGETLSLNKLCILTGNEQKYVKKEFTRCELKKQCRHDVTLIKKITEELIEGNLHYLSERLPFEQNINKFNPFFNFENWKEQNIIETPTCPY